MRATRPSLAALIGLSIAAGMLGPSLAAHAAPAAPIGPSVVLGQGSSNCAPTTVADGDGVLAVAASTGGAGGDGVALRRWSPGRGWGPSVQLAAGLQMPLSCRLNVASDGELAVATWPGYQADGRLVLQAAVRPTSRAAWQEASTLMPSALDSAAGAPDAEPALAWAVVSHRRAVVVWNTWIDADPGGGGIEGAVWEGGTWQPASVVIPSDGASVYLKDVVPTPAGVLAIAVRDNRVVIDTVSRQWSADSGWGAPIATSPGTDRCWVDVAQGGRRVVMLETCANDTDGRLWIREWRGSGWSDRVAITPVIPGFDAYTFHEIRATSTMVAVAYRVGTESRWSAYVARSMSPGSWRTPVRMVTSNVEYGRPAMFALGGRDAVLVWQRPDPAAKPGDVEAPTLARTLRADGRLLPDVTIGYGVMVTCHTDSSSDRTVVFAWTAFCDGPFRLVSWSGSGPWQQHALVPVANESFALDYTWSVTPTARADVIAWQAGDRVVAAAVPH